MAQTPLRSVLGALPLPTLAIGPDERVIALNERAQDLFGLEAVGRHFITILRQPVLVEAVEMCLQDTTARVAPFLEREGGRGTTFEVHLQRVDAQSPLILSFQDVTEKAEAGQVRRDFVANVSHELRTPLTSLMGFIETLRGAAKDDADARARFLKTMADEAERMNRLVGDLLSLSRVEAEERVRPTQQIGLSGIISTTLRNIKPLTDETNVEMHIDLGTGAMSVLGDADQLQQVFTNLIENAIKYGDQDQTITIKAEVVDHDPTVRAAAARISITDQGPGIAPEHLPRLTERFYRADNHRSRAMGGTGLGLAIVKHILNRHRGRLKITSEPGQGACFRVTLPLVVEADAN